MTDAGEYTAYGFCPKEKNRQKWLGQYEWERFVQAGNDLVNGIFTRTGRFGLFFRLDILAYLAGQVASDITQDRERNAAIKGDTLFRVNSHADHDRDAHYRAGNRNKGIKRASVLEFGKCMAFRQKLFGRKR